MKLKGKILAISLLPLIVLGVSMFFVAADKIESGIYDETYVGMQATTLAVRDIFETGNTGEYRLDDNGEFWKGEELNISQAYDIVDNIKQNTGMDVTVFWGDTRMLTSIVDASGQRQVGTQASAEVAQKVIGEGISFHDRNIDILGTEYIVYYTPLFQEGSNEVVGMVFLGTPQETVTAIIDRARLQMLFIILAVLVVAAVSILLSVSKIVKVLKKSVGMLEEISSGNLNVDVSRQILARKDEIGDVGRGILNLKEKLHNIIAMVAEKSERLNQDSTGLETISTEAYQAMEEVERSSQEMASSSANQAEDASRTSQNVSAMGDLIGENGEELQRISEISARMKEVAGQAMEQLEVLNQVMGSVKEAIDFLSRQTNLTNESVEKISSATALITAIAAQTNLLSLNASIEAARAGEHGKGFSVVAMEIQQLSEQSNSAAGEIRTMIENLNTNSAQTVQCMEEVQTAIEKQESDIARTSEVFRNVTDGIDETVSGMDGMMKKAQKLEDVRSDTVALVQNSAAIAEENSASVEEIMASIDTIYQRLGTISDNTQSLRKLSEEMKESISVFSI